MGQSHAADQRLLRLQLYHEGGVGELGDAPAGPPSPRGMFRVSQ